jgi:hypothetical protein
MGEALLMEARRALGRSWEVVGQEVVHTGRQEVVVLVEERIGLLGILWFDLLKTWW